MEYKMFIDGVWVNEIGFAILWNMLYRVNKMYVNWANLPLDTVKSVIEHDKCERELKMYFRAERSLRYIGTL